MKPVHTEDCNVVYKGSTQDIGDLYCHRVRPHVIRTTWEPDARELELLKNGGRVQLTIMKEPIPPVMLTVAAAKDTEPIEPHPWKIDAEPGEELPHNKASETSEPEPQAEALAKEGANNGQELSA